MTPPSRQPPSAPTGDIDLAGSWPVRADPSNEGLAQNWWNFYPWWDKHGAMEIPGAFQTALGASYHGVAWLARIARVPADWLDDSGKRLAHGARLRLRFNAVATDAIVQVNGVEVGRHSGDYLPFEFDITEAVELGWAGKAPVNPPSLGEFTICVRVDEVPGSRPPPGETVERGHITKGFHDVLSCQHGGIWGEVTLRRTGKGVWSRMGSGSWRIQPQGKSACVSSSAAIRSCPRCPWASATRWATCTHRA